MLAVPAVLFLGLVALALRAAGEFSRFNAVIAMLTLLVWAQAYLLVWDYGVLDGSPIDWSTPWWRGWVDLPLWLAALGAAWAWHRRIARTLRGAALALVALQAVVLAAQAASHRDVLALKTTRHADSRQAEAMAHFSSTRNVVHIVLDSFQADVFGEIVQGPERAFFEPALRGFTFFEEHLGTFTSTYMALPVIVSGQVYRNHMPQAAFMKSVYGGASILNAAHAAGYEVDLAGDAWTLNLLMQGRFDNAYFVSPAPSLDEAARLLDLALFRIAPHRLKAAVYADQRWLVQNWVAASGLSRFAYFRHNAFVEDITRNFAADRPKPVYKFFHLMASHRPWVVRPDCSAAGKVLPRTRDNVVAQQRCSLAFVVALIDKMRQAGVYDDSLIVLMGDHGAFVPPLRYRQEDYHSGGKVYVLTPQIVGAATPLLAIKPPGAKQPLTRSQSETSMTDVAATIDALLGLGAGVPGRSVMEPREPGVERAFYGQMWNVRDTVSTYVGDIFEYRIAGTVYDAKSWQAGEVYETPATAP
jgi:hypothetical protein